MSYRFSCHFVGGTHWRNTGAERWVSKINGEMNIPRAQPPLKAKELTKQAEYQAHTGQKMGGVGGGRLWTLVVVTCMWVPLSSLEVELK